MQKEEAVALLLASAFVLWGVYVVGASILRWIFGLFTREEIQPIDEWDKAMIIVTQPQQMPGGKWMRQTTRWEECDAPMLPNNLQVHDTSDPRHDARTCKHCQPLKGYSGVSYRSN